MLTFEELFDSVFIDREAKAIATEIEEKENEE